jgi:hypothetical protein
MDLEAASDVNGTGDTSGRREELIIPVTPKRVANWFTYT